MRNSLWLACILIGLTGSCEATAPSLDALRCPISPATGTPDTPAGSSDTSLFGSLTRDNAFNCNKNPEICASLGSNFSCEPTQGCCSEADLGRCTRPGECRDNKLPVCDLTNNTCVACSASNQTLGDSQCSTWNTARMDPLNRALCVNGLCAECRTNSDCKRPGRTFCDQTDNICKGCTSHGQCSPSNICKLDESLLASGDTLSNIGECVKAADVVFVDSNSLICDNTGAGGKPYCQISQAVATGKSYIRVTGSGSSTGNPNYYSPVIVSGSNQIAIIGPGRDADYAAMQAVINGVTVTGGARLTLIDIAATNTAGQPAVTCSNTGTLYVQNVLITNRTFAPQGGIYATNCTRVTVERTKITGANGYGLFINGGTGHRIINNAFINSGSASDQSGMRISGGASGLFAFNTIANNRQGVQCDTAVAITDSIVTANPIVGATQLSANCQPTRVVTMNVVLDPTYTTGTDPTLTSDAMNDTCCIDKGMPDSNMTIKDDYRGTKRPLGNAYDIGFHEAK